MKKLIFGLLLALVSRVGADEWRIDVRNSGHNRSDLVVSHAVSQQWVELLKTQTLVEAFEGQAEQPVPCVIDNSGDDPVLVWLMGGATAPYQKRSFKLAPKEAFVVLEGGLNLVLDDKKITIENADYKLWQPHKGSGGFPQEITYTRSGTVILRVLRTLPPLPVNNLPAKSMLNTTEPTLATWFQCAPIQPSGRVGWPRSASGL